MHGQGALPENNLGACLLKSDQYGCITFAGQQQFIVSAAIMYLLAPVIQLSASQHVGVLDAAAGPPKGIAKLLMVSESGRMRSPPLVEKFRRAKENMLQNWQSQPINGKLLSLERMFHEVSHCVRHTVCGFHTPAASPCVRSLHPLPPLTGPAALQDTLYEFLH